MRKLYAKYNETLDINWCLSLLCGPFIPANWYINNILLHSQITILTGSKYETFTYNCYLRIKGWKKIATAAKMSETRALILETR